MENVKIDLAKIYKTKKGNLQVGYLIPVKETVDKIGYDYFDAWFKDGEYDFLELKKYIGKTLYANFIYKDTFGGNAVKLIECICDENGEILAGR